MIGASVKDSQALYYVSRRDFDRKIHNSVGIKYPKGYCMKFVADFWQSYTGKRSTAECANHYGDIRIQDKSMDNIPYGADVFFDKTSKGPCTCGHKYYGHIGIYIGGKRFVSAIGGKVIISWLTKDSFWGKRYRGWGFHEGVRISGSVSQTKIYDIKDVDVEAIKLQEEFESKTTQDMNDFMNLLK